MNGNSIWMLTTFAPEITENFNREELLQVNTWYYLSTSHQTPAGDSLASKFTNSGPKGFSALRIFWDPITVPWINKK